MGREGITRERKLVHSFVEVSSISPDIDSGEALLYFKTDDILYQKTGSTEVAIPTVSAVKAQQFMYLCARVTHIDETDGGGTGQTGHAHPNGQAAAFDISANKAKDYAWIPETDIVVDRIIYDLQTGETAAWNAHDCTVRVDVNEAIIEASSHAVLNSSFTKTTKTLGSGSGVTVSAGDRVVLTCVGNSIAAGDDIYGLAVTIEYHLA